ncbi:SMI1/KNR4 family protein [Flavobacterium sp. H4147]|uniref:SMI1/KNR4 family protein n=1 Tax=Flavobacterium sp. H4147 TaxID=3034149 RepID=UPI0023EB87C4|nr:SMI1/KNR4 family protein [Flavobacterium sp. H4147]
MRTEYINAVNEFKNWIHKNEVMVENTFYGEEKAEIKTFQIQNISVEELQDIKKLTNNNLEDSYYYFLQEIGSGHFFIGEYFAKFELYNLEQLKEYNALVQKEIEEEDEVTEENYFMIGSHLSMGDWIGFCTTKQDTNNFDIYCHEYPIYEYAETSDELKSWRSFEDWIIKIVKTKGEESL